MLFLFGKRSSQLVVESLPLDIACAYCGTRGSLTGVVFADYLHFFWIPVLPLGKSCVTVCGHCKQTLSGQFQMPPAYRPAVRELEKQAKTPFWHFGVLALLVAAFAIALIGGAIASLTGDHRFDSGEPALGARYRSKPSRTSTPADSTYYLIQITRLTTDTVDYKMTVGLRGRFSTASATVALRDSLDSPSAVRKAPRSVWKFMCTGQGIFRRFD